MKYRQRVVIQAPTEVRSPSGGVTYTYETVDGLDDVAATITVLASEQRDPDMTMTEEMFNIVLGGHFPDITTPMTVLDGDSVYDVVRVSPTLGRRQTVLTARRVAV